MASEPFKFHTCKILHNSYLQHISTLRYFNRSFDPAALAESFRNYPLQLAIDTPELISSPFFKGFPSLGIYSEDKRLNIRRRLWHNCSLLLIIQRTGIDYRLGRLIGTKHNEQIADHRRFAFGIKGHHFVRFEFVQSHLYH